MDLSILSDNELVRIAHTEINSLTSTPLELELLKRLDALIAETEPRQPLIDVLEGCEITDADDLERQLGFYKEHRDEKPLLDVLLEFDIDTPGALRNSLDRLAKVDSCMNDLAEPLTTLQQLIPA